MAEKAATKRKTVKTFEARANPRAPHNQAFNLGRGRPSQKRNAWFRKLGAR